MNSGSSEVLNYTSINDYALYNQMTNSYPLSLTSLRIRICDIDGRVAEGLQSYTIGCIEFTEDPVKLQMEQFTRLEKILSKQQPANVVGNQIKPFGPQVQ